VLRLPRGYVRHIGGKSILSLLDGDRIVEREVQLAGGDRQFDQLASGLTPEDRIVRTTAVVRP